MIWVEATATCFGVVCVWLYVRQNPWCWPTGLVQVLLFIWIFWEVKLYSDLVLHVIYVGMQIYGWYHWLHGGTGNDRLPVTRIEPGAVAGWAAVSLAGAAAWGYGMATWTDASVPYPDAFTTVTSLVAQWLIARKRLESWLFWIAVDVVAIGVYLYKDLYFTTALYAMFLVLAVAGYLAWRRALDDDRPDPRQVRARSPGAPAPD